MSAITWRNIAGPSLAEASRPLESAQRMITGGFDAFNNVLQKQESTDRANWNQQKDNNLNTFMNTLYAAKGPEEFKRMQDSGELMQMLQGYGAQIDQSAARSAMDTRLGTLQQREKQGIEYGNFMTDERQRPVVQDILSKAALGDKEGAMKVMAANPDLRLPADLTKAIVSGERDLTRWTFEKDKMPVELAGMKLRNAGQATQNATSSLNLTKAQQEFKDGQELRALENETAAAVQNHVANKDVIGRNMGVIAKAAGLPVNSLGQPAFGSYTEEQLDTFDKAAGSNRQVQVPKARDFLKGDTAIANAFVDSLAASNKYSPRILKKARDGIRSSFDSNVNDTLVGNDAYNRALGNAQERVMLDETKAQNWSAPGNATMVKEYESIAKDVPNLIDKTTGFASNEDVADVQALVYEMANRGIETAPGSGKFVTPSPADMRNAIRTAAGGWFKDNTRANNARDILTEALRSEVVKRRVAEGEAAQKIQRRVLVREALGNLGNLAP